MADKSSAKEAGRAFLKDLPPLNALRSSVAAAELGSFTAAGQHLCVTPVAVGRMVARLEDYLGFALFVREGRYIRLTERGADFFREVTPHLAAVAHATERARRTHSSDALLLCINSAVASQWLLPRIPQFHDRYPDIDLQIRSTTTYADFDREDYDVAVVAGRPSSVFSRETELENEFLMPVHTIPIGSAELLARQPIRKLGDLLGHKLIQLAARRDLWARWAEAAALAEQDEAMLEAVRDGRLAEGPVFEGLSPALQAARLGVGLVLAPFAMVADELAAGIFVRPHPYVAVSSLSYRLVYVKTVRHTRRLQAFRSWIKEQASAYNAAMGEAGLAPSTSA